MRLWKKSVFLLLLIMGCACTTDPATVETPRATSVIARAPRTPVTESEDGTQKVPCMMDEDKYPPVCGLIPQQTEDAQVLRRLGKPAHIVRESVGYNPCEIWDYHYGEGVANIYICEASNVDKRVITKILYSPYGMTLEEMISKFGEPKIIRVGPSKSKSFRSPEPYSLLYWPEDGLVIQIDSLPPFHRNDPIYGIAYFSPTTPQVWEDTFGPSSDYEREFAWKGFDSGSLAPSPMAP
jgi:hypothetical protein